MFGKAKGYIHPDDSYLLLKAQLLRNENVLVQPKSAPIHSKIKREAGNDGKSYDQGKGMLGRP